MNEQIRKEFESWWDKAGFNTQLLHWQGNDHYRDGTVQIAWQAFRAAHSRYAGSGSGAPTDNGIKEADDLCAQYNAGDIDLTTLVCRLWNSALQVGRSEAVALINKMNASSRAACPAPAVPEGLQFALEEVREVLQRSYQNASPVCCGQGRYGECCGSPAPDWSEDDMFIMDRLGIAEKHLSAMLTQATKDQTDAMITARAAAQSQENT